MEVGVMAFQYYEFKEDEKREYTLTIWPFRGKKYFPEGGIVDIENDIRLIPYGNGPAMEPCDEFQFIFDYKGTAMNIEIEEKIMDNGANYNLLNVQGNTYLDVEILKPILREAIMIFALRAALPGEDYSNIIHINF